jgi:hypothetical protein
MSKAKEDPVPPYPKRPMNGYFKFAVQKRVEKMPAKQIKSEWDNLDQKQKDDMATVFKADMEKYSKEKDAWEKQYG